MDPDPDPHHLDAEPKHWSFREFTSKGPETLNQGFLYVLVAPVSHYNFISCCRQIKIKMADVEFCHTTMLVYENGNDDLSRRKCFDFSIFM